MIKAAKRLGLVLFVLLNFGCAHSITERTVYQIDEDRYITIQGDRECVGSVFYNNSKIGLRTLVKNKDNNRVGGMFHGEYAIDSTHVIVPISFNSYRTGDVVYVFYSTDEGRTFKWMSQGKGADLIVLIGDMLYVSSKKDKTNEITDARVYDISKDIPLDKNGIPIPNDKNYLEPKLMPIFTISKSGMKKWWCSRIWGE
jgi:hypothetical protein